MQDVNIRAMNFGTNVKGKFVSFFFLFCFFSKSKIKMVITTITYQCILGMESAGCCSDPSVSKLVLY